jgi:N-terminal half of MaoC dehydratase
VSALTELKGTELGTTKVRIESGPVRVFATAVKDGSPSYRDDDAVVPPTFPFSWSYWGQIDGSAKGMPIDKLRGSGRMILHGEQEFVYHRNARVGDILEGTARISDVYERDTASALMEFYVMETSWKDASSGEPVVDVKFTLLVRDTGVKKKEG